MSGIVIHCEWAFGDIESEATRNLRAKGQPGLPDTRNECRIADYRVSGMVKPRTERKVWLSFDTGPYFSTGKNPHGSGTDPDYEAFAISDGDRRAHPRVPVRLLEERQLHAGPRCPRRHL